MLFELQAHTCWYNSDKTVVPGATISLPANKASSCYGFIFFFCYTAPIITDTSEKPLLFEPGLMEHQHLSVTRWAWDLNKGLGIVSDRIKPNGHGCTN